MKIYHVNTAPNYHTEWKNCGDTVLTDATRNLFSDHDLTDKHCRDIFTEDDVAEMNRHDAVLIGAGGMILNHSASPSGWQWYITDKLMDMITAPIFVLSIGWNFFFGEEPSPRLLESVQLLSKKASMITLRHNADVEAFNTAVGDDVASLCFCPSMTLPKRTKPNNKNIGVLIAGDRRTERYGNQFGFMRKLSEALEHLNLDGYRVSFLAHVRGDHTVPWAYNHNPTDMTMMPSSAVSRYDSFGTVITTRGHGQMIPFAIGSNVVSIIGHPKTRHFLDDVGMSGVYPHDESMADDIIRMVRDGYNTDEQYAKIMDNIQSNVNNILQHPDMVSGHAT